MVSVEKKKQIILETSGKPSLLENFQRPVYFCLQSYFAWYITKLAERAHRPEQSSERETWSQHAPFLLRAGVLGYYSLLALLSLLLQGNFPYSFKLSFLTLFKFKMVTTVLSFYFTSYYRKG